MVFRVQKENRVYSLNVSELLKMLFNKKYNEHIDVTDVHEEKHDEKKDTPRA